MHARAFGKRQQEDALFATPIGVANYVAGPEAKRSHNSRLQAAAAITGAFEEAGLASPPAPAGARRTLEGLRRQRPRAPRQVARLTEAIIAAIEATATKPRIGHDSRLIAIQHVSQKPNDVQEVEVMLQGWKANTTASDQTLVADSGYFSRGNVVACEAEGVSPLISPSSKKHNAPFWVRLAPSTVPDKDVDRQHCPVDRMKTRLKTEDGRRLYVARKATAEPVFGIIKQTMGFRQFLTRGLEAVQARVGIGMHGLQYQEAIRTE